MLRAGWPRGRLCFKNCNHLKNGKFLQKYQHKLNLVITPFVLWYGMQTCNCHEIISPQLKSFFWYEEHATQID